MVRQWQRLFYSERYSNTTLDGYRQTDYVAVAKAFGARGMVARTLEELELAFDEALGDEGTYLIDCRVDKDELVLPMMAPAGALDDIIVKVGE